MSERQAWFDGWRAALKWDQEQRMAIDMGSFEGDTYTWKKIPHPPNPYPEKAEPERP